MSETENFSAMKADPNTYIIETFNEIKLVKEILKETRLEKKEKLNESDYILELMNEYDEKKEELKPISDKLKAAKAEFKVDNMDLFEKEDNIKRKIAKLNGKVVQAYTYKKSINDETPIIIGEGKSARQLVINLDPKMKKERM